MTQITSGVDTNYNALVLELNRRLTNGLQLQTSYTYLEVDRQRPVVADLHLANNVLNPFDLGLEEGMSNFDVPHRFSFNTVWQPKVDVGDLEQLHDRAGDRPVVRRAVHTARRG